MLPLQPPTAAQSPRIPAWQRLGLKLKFAQEAPISPSATIETTRDSGVQQKKRKSGSVLETPVKKAKVSPRDEQAADAETRTNSTPNLTRKKSVTFTAETKDEDGDSIKQLFSAWVAEQKAQDPTFGSRASISPALSAPEPPKVEEQIDDTLDESERRVNRVKKAKKEKETNTDRTTPSTPTKTSKTTSTPARPFLTYLKQYHEARDTWKFNKNHQDRILKHIFDLNAIPSEYEKHIFAYVRGLQGGVRTRLRDSALAVKVKDQEEGAGGFSTTMSAAAKKQEEYQSAMREYIAIMMAAEVHPMMGYEEGILLNLPDKAMKQRAAKRMRSERILRELGTPAEQDNEETEQSEKRLKRSEDATTKTGRRRKQRTTAVESDSSSSESSSDSDSDSDPGSSSEEESPLAQGSKEASDTSSSSSSSSDADPDSIGDDSSDDSDSA